MKYVGILFTYYIIILEGGEGSHDDVDDAGVGGQNWPKVDDVICARSLRTNQDFARTYRETTKSTEMSLRMRTIQDQTEDNV